MQTVHLMGELSQFGKTWEADCHDIPGIFKLIECQTPGFRKYLLDTHEAGGGLDIVRGSDIITDPSELLLSVNDEDIYITSIPTGAGKLGKAMLIIGLMMVGGPLLQGFSQGLGLSASMAGAGGGFAASFSAGFGQMTLAKLVGINLVLGGLSAMMTQGPETEYNPVTDETPGDNLFNGPVNVTKQNIPIPLLYGELIVGGVVISGNYRLRDDSKLTDSTVGHKFTDTSGVKFGAL